MLIDCACQAHVSSLCFSILLFEQNGFQAWDVSKDLLELLALCISCLNLPVLVAVVRFLALVCVCVCVCVCAFMA